MRSTFRRSILLLAIAAPLAACSHKGVDNCPGVSSVVETSVATVFGPGPSRDPSNILYTIEISGLKSSCDFDKSAENSQTNLEITFRGTRAPNGAAAHYRVPYFVAVSQSDRIVSKRVFSADLGFEPGETSTTFTDTIGAVNVRAGREKHTFDYEILAGLQLTKEQLQYNRTTGRLVP